MTVTLAQIDNLLNEIEENCPSSSLEQAWVPFMLECAGLVEHNMPRIAREALFSARAFAETKFPASTLGDAVKECWANLGDTQESLRIDDPSVAATRAVIGILYQQLHPEAGDFVDSISFYLQLLNNVEPHLEQQEALVKKWFSECLSSKART